MVGFYDAEIGSLTSPWIHHDEFSLVDDDDNDDDDVDKKKMTC